jgi:hypothetical protein
MAAFFERKSPLQKLDAELARLRDRAKLLDRKRNQAQADLDQAIAKRREFMLEGDLDDTKAATRFQAEVDSAVSALAGFDGSITAQAALVATAEAKLRAEQEAAERKGAAETMAAQLLQIEEMLPAWLEFSRKFGAAFEAIAYWRPEAGQVSAYIRNAVSEIQNAMELTGSDLRRTVAGVRDGNGPIPRAPVAVAPPQLAPVEAVPMQQVFMMRAARYRNADGRQVALGQYRVSALPLPVAERALKTGAAVSIADPRRRELQGMKGMVDPDLSRCEALDDSPLVEPKSHVEPIQHSAFEQHPNVPAPYIKRVSVSPIEPMPMAAARTMPPEEE